jgi:hypothetical protein
MDSPYYSESDREIMDTIRLHLYACYANVEDGREFSREELEETFATDAGLRAWVTDVAGIDPDTLAAKTNLGRAMISVCMDAWVAKVTGLSDEDTHSLIMAGLKTVLPKAMARGKSTTA